MALGVLVGETGSLRLDHRRRREVLRGDQLDRGVLAFELALDDPCDLRIGPLERRGHTRFSCCSSSVISSRRRWWRPPSNSVSRKICVISSATSAAATQAPIKRTLALLC